MDRSKLIAKIRALKEKTTGNGCTEAEALAAAEKAAALMAEHAISEDKLEIRDQSADVKTTLKAARSRLWPDIARATNCAFVHLTEGKRYRIVFVGCEPGPEIACYLRDVCDRAIDRGIADFKESKVYKSRRATSTRRKAVEDFTMAMAGRLGQRLEEIFGQTISREKYAVARDVRDEMFPDSRIITRKPAKIRFWQAGSEGLNTADKVNLARGVGEQARPAGLIGRD